MLIETAQESSGLIDTDLHCQKMISVHTQAKRNTLLQVNQRNINDFPTHHILLRTRERCSRVLAGVLIDT